MALFGKSKSKTAEEKPLTYWQKKDLERATEAKKRRNIFMSRRASEESGTGYETSSSSFVGGQVMSRSRVSFVGGKQEGGGDFKSSIESARNKVGFAKGSVGSAKTGFAKGSTSNSSGGNQSSKSASRPLGFH